MIPGVILAAGASVRMGRPKALLPVDATGESFVARLARTFADAGVEEIVVVSRPGLDLSNTLAGQLRPVRLVDNPDPDRGQLSSLLAGLRVSDRPGVQAILVGLVDVPLVAADTVRAVVAAYRRTPAWIVRPVDRGRHGHPVIFDRRVFDELRRAPLDRGAKTVVRAHEHEILEVPVEDEGAFLDIDGPEDYARVIGLPL
jgi:CTP:molybdopterin cytidylyltransferase MocA